MARIFYHTDTGNIYGVHGGAFSGSLPPGVDFIDVPEAPHEVNWPVNPSGRSGERFARVVGGVLVARVRADLIAIDQASIDALLLDSGVLRAMAKALFQVANDVRVLKGQSPMTTTTFKNLLRGLMR